MLFSTPTQFAALALALIAGWLFGLASHPGGRKWKDRYAAERSAHATSRKQVDDGLADANRRIAELERENARLAQAATVVPAQQTVPMSRTVGHPSVAAAAARPAYTSGNRPGWFDWGQRPVR